MAKKNNQADRLQSGSVVALNKNVPSNELPQPIKRLGAGPFKVVEVIPVPMHCTCSKVEVYRTDHDDQCGVNNLASVGHHQLVEIADLDGNAIEGRHSGRFFTTKLGMMNEAAFA